VSTQAWGNAAASYRPYFEKMCDETGATAAIVFLVGTKEGDAVAIAGDQVSDIRRLLKMIPVNLELAMDTLFLQLLADLVRQYPPEHPVSEVPDAVSKLAATLLARVGDIQKAVERSAQANDPARRKLAAMAGGYHACACCSKALTDDRVGIVKKLGLSAAGLLVAEYCNILCLTSHQVSLAAESLGEMDSPKGIPGLGVMAGTSGFSRLAKILGK
jgi:hypothetical protein